ncbi:hypothetical protein [Anaerotignum sp.]|uniref:hypothetical protein n=1 Tax=Anaerotignum sp. TaxID=2039241 RepID=UPI0027146E11|nr:hypothetical protein [Anaerotignum sp.]
MKQEKKTMLNAVILIMIGFWILSKIPFNQNINQEISANIYKNGMQSGETTVVIDGEKSNYLFHNDERFHGKFQILSYEKTDRKDMYSNIKWNSDDNVQKVLYFQNGTFPSMDIISTLFINEEMTEFSLMFTDGTVIATSDEVYQLYTKHVFYDDVTEITTVKDVEKIPEI